MLSRLGFFSKPTGSGTPLLGNTDVTSPSWKNVARNATFLGAGGLLASSFFMRTFSVIFKERAPCPILAQLFAQDLSAGPFQNTEEAAAWLEREFVHIANACRMMIQHMNRVAPWPKDQKMLRKRTIGLIQTKVLPALINLWSATRGLETASTTPEVADFEAGKAIEKLKYAMFTIQNALGGKYGKPMTGGLDPGPARAIQSKFKDLEKRMYRNVEAERARARVKGLRALHSGRGSTRSLALKK